MKTITVETTTGPIQMTCYYTSPSGQLCITRTLTQDGKGKRIVSKDLWTITHKATGKAVLTGLYHNLNYVRHMVREIDGDDWREVTSETRALNKKLYSRVEKVFGRVLQ